MDFRSWMGGVDSVPSDIIEITQFLTKSEDQNLPTDLHSCDQQLMTIDQLGHECMSTTDREDFFGVILDNG